VDSGTARQLKTVFGCLKVTFPKISAARRRFTLVCASGSWNLRFLLTPHLALTTNMRFCATWARPGIINFGSLIISGYGPDRQLRQINFKNMRFVY